jgi:hypothetical protein
MPWTEVTSMDEIGPVSDLEAPSVPRPAERVKGTHVDQARIYSLELLLDLRFAHHVSTILGALTLTSCSAFAGTAPTFGLGPPNRIWRKG